MAKKSPKARSKRKPTKATTKTTSVFFRSIGQTVIPAGGLSVAEFSVPKGRWLVTGLGECFLGGGQAVEVTFVAGSTRERILLAGPTSAGALRAPLVFHGVLDAASTSTVKLEVKSIAAPSPEVLRYAMSALRLSGSVG